MWLKNQFGSASTALCWPLTAHVICNVPVEWMMMKTKNFAIKIKPNFNGNIEEWTKILVKFLGGTPQVLSNSTTFFHSNADFPALNSRLSFHSIPILSFLRLSEYAFNYSNSNYLITVFYRLWSFSNKWMVEISWKLEKKKSDVLLLRFFYCFLCASNYSFRMAGNTIHSDITLGINVVKIKVECMDFYGFQWIR